MDKYQELSVMNGIDPKELEPVSTADIAAMAYINSELALAMIEMEVMDGAV